MTYVMRLSDDETTLSVRRVGERSHVQVRGAPGYAVRHDPTDPLHQFLDCLDPPSVSVLMTFVEYTVNVRNPRSLQAMDACAALFAANP